MRASILGGPCEPAHFRAQLLAVPPTDRDAWFDAVCGIAALPDDGPDLPAGGVPYLPCAIDDLLRIVEVTPVGASDVFVDVGSGLGRAATFVHLWTGAPALGLEVQSQLVREARALAAGLHVSRIRYVEGDAAETIGRARDGTTFFLYCPFGGERLAAVFARLERLARDRLIRVCLVDVPLPAPCAWLTLEAAPRAGLEVYRSALPSLSRDPVETGSVGGLARFKDKERSVQSSGDR